MLHSALLLIAASALVSMVLLAGNLTLLHGLAAADGDLHNGNGSNKVAVHDGLKEFLQSRHDHGGERRTDGYVPAAEEEEDDTSSGARNRLRGGGGGILIPSGTTDLGQLLHLDHLPSRFPRSDTPEFIDGCSWALPVNPTYTLHEERNSSSIRQKCTFFVRPSPKGNEGISEWISTVVVGHLLSLQSPECRLLIDYGPSVDIGSVVRPVVITVADGSTNKGTTGGYYLNWTVPNDFVCREKEDGCHLRPHLPSRGPALSRSLSHLSAQISSSSAAARGDDYVMDGGDGGSNSNVVTNTTQLAAVPWYRHAFSPYGRTRPLRSDYIPLQRNLPGFTLEDGMACSLGSLFGLSPHAVEYEPRLLDDILPSLNDERAFVMTLYVRTGRTDSVARRQHEQEQEEEERHEDADRTAPGDVADVDINNNDNDNDQKNRVYRAMARPIIDCALSLEARLEEAGKLKTKSHIVWSVVTDSPYLKSWIVDEYQRHHQPQQQVRASTSDAVQGRGRGIGKLPRRIVTTSSRGAHTRGRRGPSTDEFADAFLDWYLLGESDVVIAEAVRSSFGQTGALRTGRPLFDGPSCTRLDMVEEDIS